MSYLKANKPRRYELWTVEKVIKLLKQLRLISPREYQRVYKATLLFCQSYISSLFTRNMGSMLHLREIKKVINGSTQIAYELLDALQRLTTLSRFINDEFALPKGLVIWRNGVEIKVPAVKYSKLKEDANWDIFEEIFLNTEIPVCVCDIMMTDDEAREYFIQINQNAKMEFIAYMNAIRGQLSEWIREHARYFDDDDRSKKKLLPLLDVIKLKPTEKKSMIFDELIAKMCTYEYLRDLNHSDKYLGNNTIEEMYKNFTLQHDIDGHKFKTLTENVKKRSYTIKRLVEETGDSSLTTSLADLLLLYTFTYKIREYYGKKSLINYEKFGKCLFNAIRTLINVKDKNNQNDKSKFVMPDGKKTYFSYYKGRYSPEDIKQKHQYIIDRLELLYDFDDLGITTKDSKRGMPRYDTLRRLEEQGYKSPPSGKPLSADDAIGGHRIPHSKGGPTTYENCVALSKEDNDAMKDTPYDEYMLSLGKEIS